MAEAAAARMEEGGGVGSALGSAMGSNLGSALGSAVPFGGRDNAAYLPDSSGSSCCSDSADETPASDSGHSDRRGDRAPHSVVSVVVHGSPSGSGSGSGGSSSSSDHYTLQVTL